MSHATAHTIARLALEDGALFTGRAFGACQSPLTSAGEVVFNTAMTGYQEALTDPSYAGQILTMTATQVGNYGVAAEDVESARPQVAGFVVRELSRIRSNHRAQEDLSPWLARAGILGIDGIDTRALVRRLRVQGAMRGVISCDESKTDAQLIAMAQSSAPMAGRNLAAQVSPAVESDWSEDSGAWGRPTDAPHSGAALPTAADQDGPPQRATRRFRVVALDCGAKRNIYRQLTDRGCDVHVVPYDASADRIRAMQPDGLFISNGPGDPEAVDSTINTVRDLAAELPTFGICLGHQLLGLALGARTYKLKFGHRGANQPVQNHLTGRVEITSQNHGFCIDRRSLEGLGCEVTHTHMNDGTVAGFRHTRLPVFGVQYHPEASPGPHDSSYLFDCFVRMMQTRRPLSAEDVAAATLQGQGTRVGAAPSQA